MSIGCGIHDDSSKLYGQTVQSVNTVQRDLGVQFCCNLTFTSHANIIVAKAHVRASLNQKCTFLSKDVTTLTKLSHSLLKCAPSVIWSPYHLGKIAKLESVQRRFTKRLVWLRNMTYTDRIHFLKLDSLEKRGLSFDVMFTYKIFFALVNMKCCYMFAFNVLTATRRHSYKLYTKTSRINFRRNYFIILSSTYGIVLPRVTVILKRPHLF